MAAVKFHVKCHDHHCQYSAPYSSSLHIPGGCTGLCQPVDVGFNKPFKSRMLKQWDEWMLMQWDQISAVNDTPKPSPHIVSEWVTAVYAGFPPHMIQNAWTKTGYA